MIQQLNRYGPLEKPEQQKHIEVFDNPLQIVRGTYKMFSTAANSRDFKFWEESPYFSRPLSDRNYDITLAENLYNEAINIINPHTSAFRNLKQVDLEAIIDEVKPEDTDASGIYLSALLNTTDIEELDGVFQHKIFGYKLAQGKTLIIRPGSVIGELGRNMQGVLINYGDIDYFNLDDEDTKGIQLNFGRIDSLSISNDESSGILIDYETNLQVYTPLGGIEFGVDLGVKRFSEYLQQVTFTHSFDWNDQCKGEIEKEVEPIVMALEVKVRETEYMKDLKDRPEEAARAIHEYDWQQFEHDILGFMKQLEETFER